MILGMVIAYTPRFFKLFQDDVKLSISHAEIIEAEQELLENKKVAQRKKKEGRRIRKYVAPKSKFNPNEYILSDWQALGLSKRQAEVVLQFTANGVSSNEELKRIFVIPDELFMLLKDSTVYPVPNLEEQFVEEAKTGDILIELNSATHEQLITLYGIGDFYAKKIIERRESLGGFVNKRQLLEIWKFKEETLLGINERLEVDIDKVQRINLNTASIKDLASHPYIDYAVANSIVKMRMAHGVFSTVTDVLRSKLIDDELFEKIKPYLTV